MYRFIVFAIFFLCVCCNAASGDGCPAFGTVALEGFTFILRHYPGLQKMVMKVQAQKGAEGKKIRIVVRDPNKQKKEYQIENPVGKMSKCTINMDSSPQKGAWKISLLVTDSKGQLLTEKQDAFTVTTRSWPWENLDLGNSDEVISPFTPLKVTGNHVYCIFRDYQINGLGLWNQVKALRKPLLSAPVSVIAVLDGKPIVWKCAEPEFVNISPGKVQVKAEANAEGLTWEVMSTIDYDGFMWCQVALHSDKKVTVDKLSIQIPMKASEARLMHAVSNSIRRNKSGRIPEGKGVVWESRDIDKRPVSGKTKLKTELLPYLWIGGEDRGICWVADCEKGFNLQAGVPAVRIIRKSTETIFVEIDLINQKTIIDKPRLLQFGFQATPVKPMPVDWRNWYFNFGRNRIGGMKHISFCIHPYGNGMNIFGSKSPPMSDYSFIQKLHEMSRTGKRDKNAVEMWLDKTVKPFRKYVRSIIREYRKNKKYSGMTDDEIVEARIKVLRHFCQKSVTLAPNTDALIPYTDPRVQYMNVPEYEYFVSEWWAPQGEWNGVHRVFLPRSYIDYLLYQYRKMLINGYQGIYLDDMYVIPGDNPDAESAEVDDNGRVFPKMGILAMRELVKRLAVMQHQMNLSPRLTVVHMTNALLIPVFSFADISFDWEMSYGDTEFQKRFPLDFIRTETTGRQAGLVPTVINGIRNKNKIDQKQWQKRAKHLTRSTLGLTLVHEIRQNQMSDKNIDFQLLHNVYSVLHDFGITEKNTEFVPYWQKDNAIQLTNPQFRVSYYQRPGQVLMIILNTGESASAELILNREKLALLKTAVAYDLENNSALSLPNFTITIPKYDFKLIYAGALDKARSLSRIMNGGSIK